MNRSILSLLVMLLFLAYRGVLAGGGGYFEYPSSIIAVATAELSVYKTPPKEGYLFYVQATEEIRKLPSGTNVKVIGITKLKTLKGSQVWARIQLPANPSVSGWVYVTDENSETVSLRMADGSALKLPR